ncbi:hypothetical protein [Nocardia sp. NPDC050710]|uniref:hypothetical protein n=1 Tax=Nocardia sp. NPDC050710 TaxID=3157220 RepID=UPI0033E4D949
MRLDQVVYSVDGWLSAERFLGAGTRTYSKYADITDISSAFHPQHGNTSFRVPSFRVPAALGRLRTNGIASELPGYYHDGERLLLPVHPDALACADLVGREELLECEPGPDFEVIPLANARTVFVVAIDGVDIRPHQLKLHYPRRISRFTRRLREPMIELELWVADELAALGTPFLAEVCGGIFGSGGDAWGFIVREAPPLAAGRYTVPLFALYGGDIRAPQDPTLLEQLVEVGSETAETFIAERIVAPMIRLWVRAAVSAGCLLEPHGQNTLVSFTADARDIEVRYRDCGVYIDPVIRRRLGLNRPLPPMNVIGSDLRAPAAGIRSLTYDSFMGHHALDYLAELARKRFGADPDVLHEAARIVYASAVEGFPEPLLPDTVYYYDDAAPPERWRLKDTGIRPHWR